MADVVEHVRQNLIERVRQTINEHHANGVGAEERATCSCGAGGVSDHSRHLAERIVDGLRLAPDIDHVKMRVRYASAWLDWELTQLEGAEC